MSAVAGIMDTTYDVLEQLGAGGGGDIFLANHKRLGKKVVLKVDKRRSTTKPEILKREVDVLKELHHSYIPQVYDYVQEEGQVISVMEYIVGESLDRPLARGETFPQAQVIKWARELLEALVYLHSPVHGEQKKGYVHSDIKPANIMRKPDGDICLIDFNIALAIGEYSFVGLSSGYASPEHWGLDYTDPNNVPDLSSLVPPSPDTAQSGGQGQGLTTVVPEIGASPLPQDFGGERLTVDVSPQFVNADRNTVPRESDDGGTLPRMSRNSPSTKSTRRIMPDVRSDIYSLGATLYHLLSGDRPAQNAVDVVPLSEKRFSRPLVDIITKAMRPNPNERYQTAAEMLDAIEHIRENDPRAVGLRKTRRIASAVCCTALAAGIVLTVLGSAGMRRTNGALLDAKNSAEALDRGDVKSAVELALSGVSRGEGLSEPRLALTEALGVYELLDSYKSSAAVELPSAPLTMRLSPDGRTGACICKGKLVVFSAESGDILCELDADEAAASEAEFIDNKRLVFAGRNGLTCCDAADGSVLWTGAPATAIAVSGDGGRVLGIYKEESSAALYDAGTGETLIPTMNLGDDRQSVDEALNLGRHLLELNEDGSVMAVSFEGSKVLIADLNTGNAKMRRSDLDCTHYSGGFAGDFFAASLTQDDRSDIDVIDVRKTFSEGAEDVVKPFPVMTVKDGAAIVKTFGGDIYVSQRGCITRLDTASGDSEVLADTGGAVCAFDTDGRHIIWSDGESVKICTMNGVRLFETAGNSPQGLCALRSGTAIYGTRGESSLKIIRYEADPESTVTSYPADYPHRYTKLTHDGSHIVQFSADGFRTLDTGGNVTLEKSIPDSGDVYDVEFVRDGSSRLEVTYSDGRVVSYDPLTGDAAGERQGEKPEPRDKKLTSYGSDRYRFDSKYNEPVEVYDVKSGKKIKDIDTTSGLGGVSGHLADMWFAGEYSVMLITDADTAEGGTGVILDGELNAVARVPYLSDVLDGELVIDLPEGTIKKSKIYSAKELTELANKLLEE